MRQRVEWQINRKQMKINIKPGSEGERRRDWKQVSGVMRHSRGGGRMCDGGLKGDVLPAAQLLTVHLRKTTHFYSLLQPSALLRHQLLSKVEGKLEKIYSISASVVISSRKWNFKRDSLCCNFFLKPCQVTKPLTHHNLQMYIHLSIYEKRQMDIHPSVSLPLCSSSK